MAKWHGIIGFRETVETEPGIWTEQITEREYSGDVQRNIQQYQLVSQVNANINISNSISVVADLYANNHVDTMLYIEFKGAKWRITSIDIKYPRLIITLGGLYNGR